jgi:hypothetical protein
MLRTKEQLTLSQAVVPTSTLVAISSSVLVDMSNFTKYVAIIEQGVATTAGTFTATVYESTASTWAGAVATQITASITTGASQTGARFITIEVNEDALSKRYVGVYIQKADTASPLSAVVVQDGDRYLG